MPGPTQTRAIFISYRRDDAGGEAGRLFDDLTRAFGNDAVFMDVAGIEPGKDFRKSIDENVAACGILLAVIGPHWLSIADPFATRRLDSPNDFVRLEIAAALARNIPVIPVLVHGSSMPRADALPEPLQDLAYRNAVELTLPRWNSDVALLVAALKNYVHVAPEATAGTVQLPAPGIPAPKPSRLPWIIAGTAAAAIVAALSLHHPTSQTSPTSNTNTPTGPNYISEPVVKRADPPINIALAAPNPTTSNNNAAPPPLAATRVAPARLAPAVVSGPPVSEAAAKPQPESGPVSSPPAVAPATLFGTHATSQFHVELPYNVTGVYDDGRTFLARLGVDNAGHAFHPFNQLVAPGTSQMTLNDGTTFTMGPTNAKDLLLCRLWRYPIDLPRQSYSVIRILAFSFNGPQPAQPFTVRYTKSDIQEENQDFPLSISDWTAAASPRFPGERVPVSQTYVNTAAGTPQEGRYAVYEYRIPLNPNVSLRTLTLPHNESVAILAIPLVP